MHPAILGFLAWARAAHPELHAQIVRELAAQGFTPPQGLGALGWLEYVGTVVDIIAGLASTYSALRTSSSQRQVLAAQVDQLRTATAGQVYANNFDAAAAAAAAAPPPANAPAPAVGAASPWAAALSDPKILISFGLLLFALMRSRH
jgi:hypothetical protein